MKRQGLTQMPYCHLGPDIWVWDATKAYDLVHNPGEGLDRVDSVPHQLKHSGERPSISPVQYNRAKTVSGGVGERALKF